MNEWVVAYFYRDGEYVLDYSNWGAGWQTELYRTRTAGRSKGRIAVVAVF
jgi:hypothetical protein